MNRAPEETINRKSPSKHARTGMVGAVTTKGGTGTQRAPVRCPYGLHTVKGAGHVPRPDRSPYGPRTVLPYRSRTVLPVWAPYRFAPTGPVLSCPYRSRTVLLLWVPYRFARIGLVPFCPYRPVLFCPYQSRTVLLVPVLYRFARTALYCFARTSPVPFCPYRSCTVLPIAVPYHFALMLPLQPLTSLYRPRTVLPVPVPYRFALMLLNYPVRHHGAGCSTPFTFLLRLVSLYRSFQLYFIPKIIPTIPLFYISFLTAYFYLTSHSPVFIYNTALLYIVLLALCGHLQTQRVCRALHPVSGEDGILVAEVPRGV